MRTDEPGGTGFLTDPEPDAAAVRRFEEDVDELGFVMNASRLWAYQPETLAGLFTLLGAARRAGGLSRRQLGILVVATASTLGDSYCSLAWGRKLAEVADAETAAGVVTGDDGLLSPAEAALARWARRVVEDPNRTDAGDVVALRDVGFDDAQIFAVTVVVALRLAFSTVNDALGTAPDHGLRSLVPDPVLAAVSFGRAIDDDRGDAIADRPGRPRHPESARGHRFADGSIEHRP